MEKERIDKKLLVKATFWYTVSMFLTRGIGFITTPIFTRLMPKEQYGEFSVYTSWQSILLVICCLELEGTINRARFDYPEKKDFQSYISSGLVLTSLITGAVFALYMFFPHIFDRILLINRKYMYVMFAYLLANPAARIFQTTQRVEYKYKVSSAISISVALLSPILGVVGVLLMKSDPLYGRIIGQFFPYIVYGVVFYIYFLSSSRRISASNWRYALRMGLPLVFNYLCNSIMLSSDTIVAKHLCAVEQVSYLSVAHSTSHIITILVSTLNLAWAPWFYDLLKIKDYKGIEKDFKIYLWGMVSLTIALLLIGPEVIQVLGGAAYKESVYTLPAYALSGVFTVLISQIVNLEIYHKKPEYAAALMGIAAVLNIILDIWWVKLWGYRAVCYATAFCQMLLIILHYIVAQRMAIQNILTVKTLVSSLGFSLLLIPLSLVLYQSNAVRYIFIAVIAVAVMVYIIAKKEQIMTFARKYHRGK